jgi:hypothetical protein
MPFPPPTEVHTTIGGMSRSDSTGESPHFTAPVIDEGLLDFLW